MDLKAYTKVEDEKKPALGEYVVARMRFQFPPHIVIYAGYDRYLCAMTGSCITELVTSWASLP